MPEIKGSCRCGKVTYKSSAQPVFTGVCHCRDCQKNSGSAFAVGVAVPAASLTVTGTTTRYDAKADSGRPTHREFCPECGSTITQSADMMPGMVMVSAGTLDDQRWVRPTVQIYCNSAQPWVYLGGDIKRYPRMPG